MVTVKASLENRGKNGVKNELGRSTVHSKESLCLVLQKSWQNISVEVVRK